MSSAAALLATPMPVPAYTEAAAPTWVIWLDPARAATRSVVSSDPSCVVVTEAVFDTGLSTTVADVVGLVMWTWKEAPEARLTGPKPSTPVVIVHVPVEIARATLRVGV